MTFVALVYIMSWVLMFGASIAATSGDEAARSVEPRLWGGVLLCGIVAGFVLAVGVLV